MQRNSEKWQASDFSLAMANAIRSNCDSRHLQSRNEKLLFNGFWRGGDSQNVCLWLDKGTWHDAKTGEGGGCKEFARVVFDMSLPEFMARFGALSPPIGGRTAIKTSGKPIGLTKNIDRIWLELQKNADPLSDVAEYWLSKGRGFDSPRFNIGSGFANLEIGGIEIFEPQHHKLVRHRLALGPQLIAPLRGVNSDRVQNLFFRSMGDCPKEEKSRLLTGAGGWHDPDGTPRAFGFPHLIHDFPGLVLCEGMADYFAAECLLPADDKYLPLGVANASAFKKWADWLVAARYRGQVVFIYQLDVNEQGIISSTATGQACVTTALKILLERRISGELFQWVKLLKQIPGLKKIPGDLAELCALVKDKSLLQELFFNVLTGRQK